jgi:hypothetical protein
LSGPPRRTKSISAPKKRILVFTEGDTESLYLDFWYRLHRERIVLEIGEANGSDPLTLVNAAIAARRRYQRETKRGRGSGFDEYWCIFDVDDHKTLDKALILAEAEGIQIALSNPCLELWFVLHTEDQTAFVHRSKIQKRSKALYGFEKKPTQDDLDFLQRGYVAAMTRAQALDIRHEGNGSPQRSNPSTSVWALVEKLCDDFDQPELECTPRRAATIPKPTQGTVALGKARLVRIVPAHFFFLSDGGFLDSTRERSHTRSLSEDRAGGCTEEHLVYVKRRFWTRL